MGIHTPRMARAMAPTSKAWFCRRAAITPRDTPRIDARIRAERPMARLVGKPWRMMSRTLLSAYFRDGPKSPCATPPR